MAKIIHGIELGVFIVDDEDYEWLNQYEWRDHPDGYAQAIVNRKMIAMQRLIMNDPMGMQVDHKNRLVNDNRRINLRECTSSQNQHNKRKSHNKSSIFKGVTRRSRNNFEVCINKDGKYVYLGKFSDEISAANCYNYYALLWFKEFARINDIEYLSKESWELNKYNKEKSSKYRGVNWVPRDSVWRVRISSNGSEQNIGYFTNEVAAANCYNYFASQTHGEKTIYNDVEEMSKDEWESFKSIKKGTSKYIGVCKKTNRWIARIKHNEKDKVIGRYDNEIDAALAYNEYVRIHNLNKRLNIIK